MGNVAISVVRRNVTGAQRNVVADVTFSNSYATNGDTIVAADIAKLLPGAAALTDVVFFEYQNPVAGQFAVLDKTNKKFLLFSVAGVQATNATDQSSVVVRVRLHYGGTSG
jgi:hypothetical protein